MQPTSVNVATALETAILHPDLTQDLTGVYTNPLANSYPLSAYSYFVTPCSPALAGPQGASCVPSNNGSSPFSPAKGQALGQFEDFIACAGQEKMALLGYSPLPPNLVNEDFKAIGRLNGGQEPAPVPLAVDPNSSCRNPYVDGETPLPGEPEIQGQSGGGLNPGGPLTTTTVAGKAGAGGPGAGASGTGSGTSGASGGNGGHGSNNPALRGLSAAEIAAGDRLVNGQIVKALDVNGPGRFARASGLQTALAAIGGAGLGYLGWAILVLAVIVLPPLIASRRSKLRVAPGMDAAAAPPEPGPEVEP